MKNIILSAIILVGLFSISFASKAADSQVGTWAASLAEGAPNVFYQGKLNDKSAWLVAIGSSGGATGVYGFYKGYLASYANGPYWKAGALFANSGSASGVAATGGFGYEVPVGDDFVIGAFIVGFVGVGGTASAWDISLGYKF